MKNGTLVLPDYPWIDIDLERNLIEAALYKPVVDSALVGSVSKIDVPLKTSGIIYATTN